jgi:hypothetical protein
MTAMRVLDREARQDVADLLVRYAAGIDRRDWWMRRTHEPLGHTLHRITNQAAAYDGDAVTVRSYVDVIVLGPDNVRGAQAIGFYDDVVVRTGDGWKFAGRRFTQIRIQAIGAG